MRYDAVLFDLLTALLYKYVRYLIYLGFNMALPFPNFVRRSGYTSKQ